jgi:uncharacterized repeat protein (TIGR02543 family)
MNQPAAASINAGQSATFTATATGTPAPTEQWERSTDGSNWSAITGATGATYSFTTAKTDHGAQYRARASNASGSAISNPATLTVFWAPIITTHPANQAVSSPNPASFSVAMDCNPDATSQWQSSANGTSWQEIPGATGHTYSTGATSTAMNNLQYRCVCTNTVGSAISNPASLIVDAPVQRTVTFVAGSGGVVAGTLLQTVPDGGSTASVTAVPNGGFTFVNWTGDGFAPTTANPLSLNNVLQDLTITANFTPAAATYTITATAGIYGHITPSGAVSVNSGGNITFTITPDAYYMIGNVLVDGVSVGAVGSYTFSNVTSNHTISASFEY